MPERVAQKGRCGNRSKMALHDPCAQYIRLHQARAHVAAQSIAGCVIWKPSIYGTRFLQVQ